MRPFLFFSVALVAMIPLKSAEQQFTSGEARVALLELFTSEGCSSCPPAERWLGGLRDSPGLWREFVPMAFHVNYWDRLGWSDRFASREATSRQSAYSARWGSRSVYTPCFVRDGKEWRPDQSLLAHSGEKAGVLSVRLGADRMGRVTFSPAHIPTVRENFEVQVALLGSGFTSRVTAGENRGETLRHEFVVLALAAHPLVTDARGIHRAEFALPSGKITDAPRSAVAFCVVRRGELVTLQATGGWLLP